MFPVHVSLNQQQMAHPLVQGQDAIARIVRRWLDDHQGACTPSDDVAAIIDDSGSMADNDPEGIRRSAMKLLISKPGAQNRLFGAVEFAGSANPLFAPGLVSEQREGMFAALAGL